MPLSPPKAYIRIIQNFQFIISSFSHYLCLCPQLFHPGHWYMSKDQVYQPFWPTGRPPAPASRPVAFLSPCWPGPVGFSSCQPRLQKKMYALWWPGLAWTKLVEQQGWCHRHTSSSHLLLIQLTNWQVTKRSAFACVDQISQLVFGHLSLVPPSTSSRYWLLHVRAGILCACIPDKRRLCDHWVRQFFMQCNIVLHGFVIIRQELCCTLIHAAEEPVFS